jgi:hypothetical protein
VQERVGKVRWMGGGRGVEEKTMRKRGNKTKEET